MIDIRPEIKIYRSHKNIFAQLLENQKTTVGKLYRFKKGKKPIDQARLFGKDFGQQIVKRNIKKIRFNRGKHLYHGKIKLFAEGLRESGLEF